MARVRLSDDELVEHATAYRTHRTAENAEKALAEAERDVVCDEMKARRKSQIDIAGLRIFFKTSQKRVSLLEAKAHLKRAIVKAITRETVNKEAWDAEVRAGRITKEDDLACKVDTAVTPYIIVNDVPTA